MIRSWTGQQPIQRIEIWGILKPTTVAIVKRGKRSVGRALNNISVVEDFARAQGLVAAEPRSGRQDRVKFVRPAMANTQT